MAGLLHARLTEAFAPARLEVIDESAAHAGHSGARPGGETHFRVVMRAAAFDGIDRVARSRAVHAALREPLETRVHALALDLGGVAETPAR